MADGKERDILAADVLKVIGESVVRLKNEPLTAFLSLCGNKYNRELMVVGRAANGWMDENPTSAQKLSKLSEPASYANRVLDYSKEDSDEMAWVVNRWGNSDGYNTNRSPFWRVSKSVLESLTEPNEDWSSYLAWSNLYKVSPVSGGNPSNRLCDAQLAGCIKLFNHELDAYKPKRLLMITGNNWATGFVGCGKASTPKLEAVDWVGMIPNSDTKVVVAKRPEGRKEAAWCDQVLEGFIR